MSSLRIYIVLFISKKMSAFRKAATDSISRSRRLRGDNSPTAGLKKRSTFGVDTSKHKGIASSEKNRSLRDLVSRVNFDRKTPPSSPTVASISTVPKSFEDAPAALSFLEAEVSRTNPGLLRATSMIGGALTRNDHELIKLRRDVSLMQDQLQDQTEARAIQRQLHAVTDQLERALADAAAQREEANAMREEASALQMKLRSSKDDIANDARTMRRDLSAAKTTVRQKETELEILKQRDRDLSQQVEDLKRAHSETEDSCNDIVQRTQRSAEDDRLALKQLKDKLNHLKQDTRKDKTEYQFEQKRTAREMDDLKEEVRQRTLRTAMRALHRMEKYSIWKAFAKLKQDMILRTSTHDIADQVILLNNESTKMKQQMKNMINAKKVAEQREANMLNIISWLLDMHSGMIDDDQSVQFLQELREVFSTAKVRVLKHNNEDEDNLVVTEVGMSP